MSERVRTTADERRGLADLMLEEQDGTLTRYLDAIGGLRETHWYDKGLAIGRLWVSALDEKTRWLAAYDFDGDGILDKGEMTQGWLVKTAELTTGRTYGADALVIYGKTAALQLAAATTRLNGVSLATDEERAVRKALDETETGKDLTATVNEAFASSAGSSGGDSGGGSSGGSSGSDSGSSGGSSCFTAETRVWMADGSHKRIADIGIGDKVTSFDFANDEQVASTVERLFAATTERYLRLNGLQVTEKHPFAIGGDEWVAAGDLRTGDKVLGDRGWQTIEGVERVDAATAVYNMTVGGTHNYYVADGDVKKKIFLAHNKGVGAR